MNPINRYRYLAAKWLDGRITPEEKEEFSAWYKSHADEELNIPEDFATSEQQLKERILQKVMAASVYHTAPKEASTPISSLKKMSSSYLWWAAASIAILLTVGGIVYQQSTSQHTTSTRVITLNEVQPGSNKAILSLEDGREINLAGEGVLFGDKVSYLQAGSEEDNLSTVGEAARYMTVSTPNGGDYHLVLSDGTQVWLNAASTIRFPRTFGTADRAVELLAGEAYFDVAKAHHQGRRLEFSVKTQLQTTAVLGTKFNVNIYDAQRGVVTTVSEGAVQVSRATNSRSKDRPVVLKRGMQTVLNQKQIRQLEVDPDEYLAWKAGYFYFHDANLREVLDEFARWYDLDVHYELPASDDLFFGKIPKNVPLGAALKVLKATGARFELLDGRQLIVKQK